MTDHVLEALAAVGRGWHVFPIRPDKSPYRGTRGFLDATADPNEARAALEARRDSVGYGIACGASRLFVVDIDGLAGADSYVRLRAAVPGITETYVVRTGRDEHSRHIYFRLPDGVDDVSSGPLPDHPGIDVKTIGGYVVGAGSTHPSGAIYTATGDPDRIPEAPAGLLDLRRTGESPSLDAPVVRIPDNAEGIGTPWGKAALVGELNTLAGWGEQQGGTGRHGRVLATARRAAELRTAGHLFIEFDEVAAMIWRAAVRNGVAEERPAEIRRTIRDGWEKGIGTRSPIDPEIETVVDAPARAWRPGVTTGTAETVDPVPEIVAERQYERTGFGLRDEFLDLRGETVRVIPDARHRVHRYRGGRWVPDPEGAFLAREAAALVEIRYAEAKTAYEEALEEHGYDVDAPAVKDAAALLKWWRTRSSSRSISEIVSLVEPEITNGAIEDYDPDRMINTPSGVLDLREGIRTRPHSPRQRFTMISGGANTGETSKRWEAFLKRTQPDEEVREFLRTLTGAVLVGELDRAVVHYGSGANGKSVFLTAVRAALGDYATTVPISVFAGKANSAQQEYALADLRGKRLAISNEPDLGGRLSESLVKTITGGDYVAARFPYGRPFTFRTTHTVYLATNHLPFVNGADAGLFRRLLLVPWDVVIPEAERDTGLASKIVEHDLDGVFSWLYVGLERWLREGLVIPASIRNQTEQYRDRMDPLGRFLHEMVVEDPGAEGVGGGELYAAYAEWCDDEGEAPMSMAKFGVQMVEKGYEKTKTRTVRLYAGLRLRHSPVRFRVINGVLDRGDGAGPWSD